MSWIIHESITHDPAIESKTGKIYAGWRWQGTRKGYNEPDQPYEKVVFDNSTVTVIEHGLAREGMSLVQFLQKAVQPGDTVKTKSEKDGRFWRIATVENISKRQPTYEPLSAEEAAKIRAKQEMAEIDAPDYIPEAIQSQEIAPF